MANIFDKIKGAVLGPEYEEDIMEEEYVERKPLPTIRQQATQPAQVSVTPTYQRTTPMRKTSGSKVVNINTNIQMEVVVTSPQNLEEARDVCDEIKEKKTVVVNLENVEHDIAQRISDFLCGACYALDGSVQLVSDGIIIIGPVNVELTGQFKEELQANGIKLPYTQMWK